MLARVRQQYSFFDPKGGTRPPGSTCSVLAGVRRVAPGAGIVAEVMCVFARKKLFAYKVVLYTFFATGILSFFVWAHHQFISGIDPRMANIFTVTTVLISVPLAETMFIYIATLYGGSITLSVPMLWALSFIATFLIGGVTGIYLGASGSDIYMRLLRPRHYGTFYPIAIIGVFTGPPTGSGNVWSSHEQLAGKIHFWITIIAFNCIFLLFVQGAGQHRRIFNFRNFPELSEQWMLDTRVFATCALVVMLLAQFIFLGNFFYSMFRGKKAERNPYNANTLEWVAPSPPGHGNFETMPTVYRGPYEYSVPNREDDYWPQNVPG